MIPAPYLNEKVMVDVNSLYNFETSFQYPKNNVYAYESYAMDRTPNAFYVQMADDRKYVAYVEDKQYLTKDLTNIRTAMTSASNLNGYIYHSTVVPYKDSADKIQHGFITFMIQFEYKEMKLDSDDYVCSIKLVDAPGTMPDNGNPLDYYKKYIYTTNINMQNANFKPDVLETLRNTLTKLTDSTLARDLYRTNKKFCVYEGSTSNLTECVPLGDKKYMMVQVVIPYNKGNAQYAKNILAIIARRFLGIIRSRGWQQAMLAPNQVWLEIEELKTKWLVQKEKLIKNLWHITTWVIVRNFCRKRMDVARSNAMANIFKTFQKSFVENNALPKADAWKEANKHVKSEKAKNPSEYSDTATFELPFEAGFSKVDFLSNTGLEIDDDTFLIPTESDTTIRNWN